MKNGLILACVVVTAVPAAGSAAAQDCVDIGIPKPTLRYTYTWHDARGHRSQYTTQWEYVRPTGMKGRTVKIDGEHRSEVLFETKFHIDDEVAKIERSITRVRGEPRLDATTSFRPAATGDPGLRACAGKRWKIAPVTATNVGAQGAFSAPSDPGILEILSIHEPVTVPAGRFDTVHYVRSTASKAGPITDEYWKSIEHGVIVKHHSVLPGGVVDEQLQSIR